MDWHGMGVDLCEKDEGWHERDGDSVPVTLDRTDEGCYVTDEVGSCLVTALVNVKDLNVVAYFLARKSWNPQLNWAHQIHLEKHNYCPEAYYYVALNLNYSYSFH